MSRETEYFSAKDAGYLLERLSLMKCPSRRHETTVLAPELKRDFKDNRVWLCWDCGLEVMDEFIESAKKGSK